MNEQLTEVLVRAAMLGQRQIFGALADYGTGGRCALGVLQDAGVDTMPLYNTPVTACPFCGAGKTWTNSPLGGRRTFPILNEARLVVHLNNDHEWDFMTIARKLELPLAEVRPA